MLGYPILSMRSIPKDPRVPATASSPRTSRRASSRAPLDINDVWPENYSANSAQKVWAAKFAARHPNVVVLDLSRFKCGHDAPTYGLIDSIIVDVGDAVLGAARHRRQQAGRLDQDPRQDVRAHAEAPRGAARGHGASAEDELDAPHRREAARAARAQAAAARRRARSRTRRSSARSRRSRRRSRRTCAAGVEAARAPKGIVQLGKKRKERDWFGSASRSGNDRRSRGGARTRRETKQTNTSDHADDEAASKLPILGAASVDIDIDAELKKFEIEQSARASASSRQASSGSTTIPTRRSRASQRAHTTLLDLRPHDGARPVPRRARCAASATRSSALDVPDNDALHVRQGVRQPRPVQPDVLHRRQPREVPDRLRDKQTACRPRRSSKNYVFLTAGACGPCRFGMYVTEYRKALRDAGFDGFRVMLFQQTGGLKQATGEERASR